MRKARADESQAAALRWHKRRSAGLRQSLNANPNWQVKSWASLDSPDPTIAVELLVSIQPGARCELPISDTVAALGDVMRNMGTSDATAAGIQELIIRLHGEQQTDRIDSFEIHFANGARIWCPGAAEGSGIQVMIPGAKRLRIT